MGLELFFQKAMQPFQTALFRIHLLFTYRGLLYYLVLREVKVRYKNSVLGFIWSLLNPLAMMLVFTLVFGLFFPSDQRIEKYPVFLLCGLLPWNYFVAGVLGSVNCITGNANLVNKVYFPRDILPLANILAQLVNFLLALVVLFGVLIIARVHFTPWLWLFPIVIIIQTTFMFGVALLLSTINVFYRDVGMIMDVVILAWFFLTPIFYPASRVPISVEVIEGLVLPARRIYYILNPMASIISMYRDLFFHGYRTDPDFFLRTTVTALLVLALGYWVFLRYQGRLGEEV